MRVQRTYPDPNAPEVPPRLNKRVDSLVKEMLTLVERDGPMPDGQPHPLLPYITALVGAGAELRRFGLERSRNYTEQRKEARSAND
ncbi:hypothetical protein [Streptomyces sp. NPDC020917]|uniref:hypothetical protein n=1 Tax=Streptomyces sp. NPDC020917 TaxID=3365102 RepID=UPI0037A25F5C